MCTIYVLLCHLDAAFSIFSTSSSESDAQKMTLNADVIPIDKMAVSTSAGNHNAPGIPNLSAYGGGPRLIQAPRVMDGSGAAGMPAQATADLMSMMTMTAKQPFAPQQQQVWQRISFISFCQ